MQRRFTTGDLTYLANLCHDCRGCYYSCQYAPPHEFALNLPKAMADLRLETYEHYAWPRALAGLFRRNSVTIAVVTLLGAAGFVWFADRYRSFGIFGLEQTGTFYAVIPEAAMIAVTGGAMLFALLALGIGLRNFWRDTTKPTPLGAPSLLAALSDILTLRNLGGGGDGCNFRDEAFSQSRRYFHQALFYGFLLCLASTCTAAIYEHIFGWIAPYSFFSLPVLLGAAGGVGMLIGAAGLLKIKISADPAPASKALFDIDYSFLALVSLAAASGLLLLALRNTVAMSMLLAAHLGVIVALFLMLPYCKFVHGMYRAAALLRSATDRQSRSQKKATAAESVGA